MKKAWVLTTLFLGGSLLMTGCGSKKQNVYNQAGKDLAQEYYEYALQGYEEVIAERDELLPMAYRGAGIANLRMNHYDEAIEDFTNAMNCEKVSKGMKKDLLAYRATAYLKAMRYEEALSDCQVLTSAYDMDANSWFLRGMVALAMDSYQESRDDFDHAYEANPTYEMAIRIYQVYLEKGMEADGTHYLEVALNKEPKTSNDYCDRGKVYYYMQDYDNARKALTNAANDGNVEALLLLGMVYLGKNDVSNARSMYQEYIAKVGNSAKGYNGLAQCDMEDGNYNSALEYIHQGLEIASTEEMQDLLYNEMVIYERELDFATAKEKAKEYLAKFPGDERVAREMQFLESRTISGAAENAVEEPASENAEAN